MKYQNYIEKLASEMYTKDLEDELFRASVEYETYLNEVKRRLTSKIFYLIKYDGEVIHIGTQEHVDKLRNQDEDTKQTLNDGFLFTEEQMESLIEDYHLQKRGIA